MTQEIQTRTLEIINLFVTNFGVQFYTKGLLGVHSSSIGSTMGRDPLNGHLTGRNDVHSYYSETNTLCTHPFMSLTTITFSVAIV